MPFFVVEIFQVGIGRSNYGQKCATWGCARLGGVRDLGVCATWGWITLSGYSTVTTRGVIFLYAAAWREASNHNLQIFSTLQYPHC
jgi:hypothetical protein